MKISIKYFVVLHILLEKAWRWQSPCRSLPPRKLNKLSKFFQRIYTKPSHREFFSNILHDEVLNRQGARWYCLRSGQEAFPGPQDLGAELWSSSGHHPPHRARNPRSQAHPLLDHALSIWELEQALALASYTDLFPKYDLQRSLSWWCTLSESSDIYLWRDGWLGCLHMFVQESQECVVSWERGAKNSKQIRGWFSIFFWCGTLRFLIMPNLKPAFQVNTKVWLYRKEDKIYFVQYVGLISNLANI